MSADVADAAAVDAVLEQVAVAANGVLDFVVNCPATSLLAV